MKDKTANAKKEMVQILKSNIEFSRIRLINLGVLINKMLEGIKEQLINIAKYFGFPYFANIEYSKGAINISPTLINAIDKINIILPFCEGSLFISNKIVSEIAAVKKPMVIFLY